MQWLGSLVLQYSPFYASLADRYGRKLCLIIPTLGYSAYVSFLLYMALHCSSGGSVSLTELALCCALGLFGLGIRYVHKQKCLLVFRRSLEVQLFLYIFHANTLTSLLPLLHLIYSIDTILSHHIHIHSGSFATYQMALFSYAADITDTDTEKHSGEDWEVEEGEEENDLSGTRSLTSGASTSTSTSRKAYTNTSTKAKGTGPRCFVYSLLESSLFFSKTVGPLCSGLYAESLGFVGPLVLSLSLCGLTLAFVVSLEDEFIEVIALYWMCLISCEVVHKTALMFFYHIL